MPSPQLLLLFLAMVCVSVCVVCVVGVTHPKVVVAQGVWDEGASMAKQNLTKGNLALQHII